MRQIFIVLTGLLLANCSSGSSYYFAKPDMKAETTLSDTEACLSAVQGSAHAQDNTYTSDIAASAVLGLMQGAETARTRNINYDTCMEFRGYHKKIPTEKLKNSLKGKSNAERIELIVASQNNEEGEV